MKRGQVGIEYLIIVGFVAFLVIIILGVAFLYTSGAQDRIKVNQISGYANKIVSASESVFYSGEPSKLTVTAYLPAGVTEITVEADSLFIRYLASSGENAVSFESNVPLSGNLSISEGVKRIVITAQDDAVYFSEG